jgi:surface antigen
MLKRLSVVVLSTLIACSGFSTVANGQGLQCAEFARIFSGIEIFGDARSWWDKAVGKYARGFTPESGSVLVFKPNPGMSKGHVAVVSHVLTDRIIQVTHANWSPIDGARGRVEQDVTVVDVSPTGDWSQVKVWYDPAHSLGNTVYPTYGFIYSAAQHAANFATRVANAASGNPKARVGSLSAQQTASGY